MRPLTDDGRAALEAVAQRHNVSFEAVASLMDAIDRGNGTQAQFSHFELGGMGQWSRGGMIMIGDMFNTGLKFRVDHLCNELSDLRLSRDLFLPEPVWSGSSGGGNWWPASCGVPSSTGSQNDMHYALFPATRRLALKRGGDVRVYDTGDHQITGFAQSQGGDTQNLTFTSQHGTVRLFDLGLIAGEGTTSPHRTHVIHPAAAPADVVVLEEPIWQAPGVEPPSATPGLADELTSWLPEPVPAAAPAHVPVAETDVFAKIERLHGLMLKGILSEEEFTAKKKELLDRI